ncbi:MAG: glycosyltransferase family 4 protein, partial [Actinobacteria bacterium]
MKIAHLTSVHSADDVRILHRECASLAREGHDVAFICGRGDAEAGERLGVRIVPVRPARGRLGRMLVVTGRVLRAALRERADLYHYHDPELLGAALVLLVLGKRVVFDVHEDLPKQILTKHWIPGPLRRMTSAFARALERPTAHAMSGVVAAIPSVLPAFPARHVALVQNFPTLAEFCDVPERPVERSGAPKVGFFGGISAIRGATEIVAAIGRCTDPDVRLVLAGAFTPAALEDEVRELPGWE